MKILSSRMGYSLCQYKNQLEQATKEPNIVLFFVVPHSNLHTRKKVNLSNPKMSFLYDLPLQNELNGWRKIKVLSSSLGIEDIKFN